MGECAKLLMGCYRQGDAADPVTYSTGVAAVLSDYPEDVVRRVTDPRTGIPSRLKWLPSIAEVREACEAIEGPKRRDRERERRIAEQLRMRALPPPSDDDARERALENVMSRFGETWGLDVKRPGFGLNPADACMATLGISQAEFDAIPDRVPGTGE